jgi:hypothetical protein
MEDWLNKLPGMAYVLAFLVVLALVKAVTEWRDRE